MLSVSLSCSSVFLSLPQGRSRSVRAGRHKALKVRWRDSLRQKPEEGRVHFVSAALCQSDRSVKRGNGASLCSYHYTEDTERSGGLKRNELRIQGRYKSRGILKTVASCPQCTERE